MASRYSGYSSGGAERPEVLLAQKVLFYPDRSKGVDHKLLSEKLSEQKIIEHLTDIIDGRKQTEEKNSKVFKILVGKIRQKLLHSGRCDDLKLVDQMAGKLALFVQDIMKETYIKQNKEQGKENWSDVNTKSTEAFVSGEGHDTSSEKMIAIHEPLTSDQTVVVEELKSTPKMEKTGRCLRIKQKDGRTVEVEGVKVGNKQKAIIRRELAKGEKSKTGDKWSTWMIEVADHTKDWTQWIEETVAAAEERRSNSSRERNMDKERGKYQSGRSLTGSRWRSPPDETHQHRVSTFQEWLNRKSRAMGASEDPGATASSSTESVWSMREVIAPTKPSDRPASPKQAPASRRSDRSNRFNLPNFPKPPAKLRS